ncbi:MAG: cbb3-type cytochrome c oxidase subunit I, partial [Acidimicrobiales bacterium]|nr:cbb3-type cytochrome c oxidase subunit I [Acidimicrobiales bacterium]
MAVTETPPETVEAASAAATSAPRSQPSGLAAVLGSGDHKTIGRLYVLSSLLLGAGVLVLGLLFGVEAVKPETWDVFSSAHAMQLFTLLRVATVFLLAFPLVIGVALVVVPLQVGAHTVAFPRAAAASYWGWLLGSILLIASYIADGGPFGTSAQGIDLWIAALGLVVVSLLVAAVSLATTVLALRAPGMTLDRTPLYAWSVAVAAVMWLVTLPVMVGFLVLMYVDHRHAGVSLGSSSSLYGALSWIFRNPQIYVVAIPVLGFVGDVVSTSAGTRSKGRGLAHTAIGIFGTVSFGAFLAVPSTHAVESVLMIVLALVAVVPVLAIGALAADSVRRGKIKVNPGLAYALASLVALLLGTVAGAAGTIPGVLEVPEGALASDSIFFLGVTHAVVMA